MCRGNYGWLATASPYGGGDDDKSPKHFWRYLKWRLSQRFCLPCINSLCRALPKPCNSWWRFIQVCLRSSLKINWTLLAQKVPKYSYCNSFRPVMLGCPRKLVNGLDPTYTYHICVLLVLKPMYYFYELPATSQVVYMVHTIKQIPIWFMSMFHNKNSQVTLCLLRMVMYTPKN